MPPRPAFAGLRSPAEVIVVAVRWYPRAVDQHGQVIDVLVSARRHADAARRFFQQTPSTPKVKPTQVVTDPLRSTPLSCTN